MTEGSRLARLEAALTKIASDEETVYLACSDLPMCNGGSDGEHEGDCAVGIARAALAEQPSDAGMTNAEADARNEVLGRMTFSQHYDPCPAHMSRVRNIGPCDCGVTDEAITILDAYAAAVRDAGAARIVELEAALEEANRDRAAWFNTVRERDAEIARLKAEVANERA